jgi:hypothetical protein
MAKKKSRITGTILSLIFLVPKLFSTFFDIGKILKMEAHYAVRKVTILLFLSLICAILFTSTWLGLLGLLYLYISTKLSAIASLSIVLLLNIFFMVIVGLVIFNLKRDIFFPETLQHLRKVKLKGS